MFLLFPFAGTLSWFLERLCITSCVACLKHMCSTSTPTNTETTPLQQHPSTWGQNDAGAVQKGLNLRSDPICTAPASFCPQRSWWVDLKPPPTPPDLHLPGPRPPSKAGRNNQQNVTKATFKHPDLTPSAPHLHLSAPTQVVCTILSLLPLHQTCTCLAHGHPARQHSNPTPSSPTFSCPHPGGVFDLKPPPTPPDLHLPGPRPPGKAGRNNQQNVTAEAALKSIARVAQTGRPSECGLFLFTFSWFIHVDS